MLGVTTSSITSGRITARTGRYKAWPIAGSSLAALGVVLLAFLDGDTTRLYISAAMLSIGLGFGMVMPTSTLAVQNSVEWHDLGVATSLVTFFRSLGGAVGLAVCGAIFNARMLDSGVPEQLLRSPSAINDLPPGQREPVIDALADAIGFIFVVVTPVMIVCVVLSLFVKEIPLRSSSAMQRGQADQAAASAAH
jgi:MFS family permease